MENNNIFTEFQQKKQQVCRLADAALEAGWLDEAAHQEILSKIKEDVLTIGVIGQMKCGKSTFLNSFLFGKPFLPAATTPMTAALSVITYGEKEGLIAEFYDVEEWEQLKDLAQRNENEESDLQTKSSIKAAKELYEKSTPIRSQLSSLLGKTQEDNFDNLIEYVGADGKYVSIVKSVRIYLKEEWLKGVEIVDTPGFNDPVVSREERTKEFLKRADVVLMMLYAGRAFDATDRDILFDKVRKVGVGKIILAVNKYDIQLLQGETPEQIKEFVSDEIRKALREYREEALSELLKDLDPILLSAQMALMAKMPMNDIRKDPDLKHHYDKAMDDFELSSQDQLLKLSCVADLENKVREIISTQKEAILIKKPINLIFQKAKNQIDVIHEELMKLEQQKEALSIPDEDLEQQIENYQKAYKRIVRKIDYAESDLGEAFDENSVKAFRDLQDFADSVRDDCERIIDDYSRGTLSRKLSDRIDRFRGREWPRKCDDIEKQLQRSLNENIHQLVDEITVILNKYVDDSGEIVEQFTRILKKGLKESSLSNSRSANSEDDSNTSTSDDDFSVADIIGGILILPVLPFYGIFSLFETGRDEARDSVRNYFSSMDWEDLQSKFAQKKDCFLSKLSGDNAKALLEDLTKKVEAARGTKAEKEQKLAKVIADISDNTAKLEKINSEYEELKQLIS